MQYIAAALLALSSSALAVPTPQAVDAPSCCDSENAVFHIDSLRLEGEARYSTPSHLATSEAELTFNVTISAIDEVMVCSGENELGYPDYFRSKWYPCNNTKDSGATTAFQYDYLTGDLHLSATWPCEDERTGYTVEGFVNTGGSAACDHNTLTDSEDYDHAVVDFCFDAAYDFPVTNVKTWDIVEPSQ